MVNQELLSYIKQQQAANVAKEEITKFLVSGGWNAQDVAEGFAAVSAQPSTTRPPYVPQSSATIPTQPIVAASATESPAVTRSVAPAAKKSNTLSYILIGLLCILVTSGVAFAYIEKLGPFAGAPTPAPSDTTAAMPEPVATTTLDTITATTSAQVGTTTSGVAQNCGSVDYNNLYTGDAYNQRATPALSPQEKSSLKCASKAFVDCTPAKFTLTNVGKDGNAASFIVGNKSDSLCPVTAKTSSPTVVCRIPMGLISQFADQALDVDRTDLIFAVVPNLLVFAAMGYPIPNQKTGGSFTVACGSK